MAAVLFVIILFIVCVGGCWAVFTALGNALFPDKETLYKPPIIHNHYYHTEQHLHVSKEDLTSIIDTSYNPCQSE